MTFYVYILTNKLDTVLYTGVTNSLDRRMFEHSNKTTPGFTAKYNLNKLIYFETFSHIVDAIAVEKKIKGWTRSKKIRLIESMNPYWEDLFKKFNT